MRKQKKLLLLLIVIIIIAGIIVAAVRGPKLGIEYADSKEIQIYLAQGVNTDDIKEIADYAFNGKENEVSKLEFFNDAVAIHVANPTDEEMTVLVKIINDVYDLEYTTADLQINDIPKINIMDIVTPYLLPVSIAMIIIIVYCAIRYRELGIIKAILTPIIATILAEGLLFSIIFLLNLPINRYTMPLALATLLVTITGVVAKFEKDVK